MIKRISLLLASIATAGVLALGLAAAGFGPAQLVAADQTQPDPAAAAAADQVVADPSPTVQTETVYVRAAPAPKVIHVTKHIPAHKVTTKVVVQRTPQPRGGGDDNGGGEREGDD